ncbi:hypothetical protein ACFLR8_04060 [Bacteroidota bacterium]
MKTKNKIKKWTEPLVYVVLVAAFGFITTVVNHTGREQQLNDTEFVSLTLESELEALYYQEETGVSL